MKTLAIHTVYDTKVNNVKRHLIRRVMLINDVTDITPIVQSQILEDETFIEASLHDCTSDCKDAICNKVSGLEVTQ